MKNRFFLIFTAILCGVVLDCNALSSVYDKKVKRFPIDLVTTDITQWGTFSTKSSDYTSLPASNEFIIDSDETHISHTTKTSGVYIDTEHVVFMMADKIVDDGGEFIPVEMWCNGEGYAHAAWTQYIEPRDTNIKPQWLCADGKHGENCSKTTTTCEEFNATPDKRSALSVSKKRTNELKESLIAFASFDSSDKNTDKYYYQSDVILGITEYLEHGVIAQPVRVTCIVNDKGDNEIEITQPKDAVKRILCPTGYKPNKTGTDCVCSGADSGSDSDTRDKQSVEFTVDKDAEGDTCIKFEGEEGCFSVDEYSAFRLKQCWKNITRVDYRKCFFNE